jgi:NAD(P)-dependent dehydrogenase (short-subunit alcohol dehydrogenase family)
MTEQEQSRPANGAAASAKPRPARVMIFGGTGGIGLALAGHYLRQGAEVAVCGRDPSRVAGTAVAGHPQLQVLACDIADPAGVAAVVDGFGAAGLDLLIVAAGQYVDAAGIARDRAATLSVLRVNVGGLQHAFDAAARRMLAQGHGQLVAIASIAGLMHDYPGASLYSASKRAAIAICDSYRLALAPHGIAVTALVPGYVDTAALRALNGGDAGAKPFLLSERAAVARMAAAIAGRRARCVFPWQLHVLIRLFNCLPAVFKRVRKK